MRVLVITRAPWRDDNNTGNTLSNFFNSMDDCEFYNLYLRNQKPLNNIAKKSFSISETQLARNLLRKEQVGCVVDQQDVVNESEDRIYSSAKKHSSTTLMLLRDLLWSIGHWKSDTLKAFLNEIKPDVIFMPVFNCFYPHKVLRYVKKITGAKVILFHADDNYTLTLFTFSPLAWLYRFNLRKWIRRSVKISDINYAISDLQKREYEKTFKKPLKVLTKSVKFSVEPNCKSAYNRPLQLVFIGNIIVNRWKSLSNIANVLERINSNGIKAQLRIYTGNTLTDKMNNALNRGGSSFVMGSVTADKVIDVQRDADMLVHVEALDLRNKLTVRQSFSTKIVDYLAASRPILAFGPKDVASIDHFVKNDCAIVADNEDELFDKLCAVISDNNKLNELSKKAFECGKKFHNKDDIDNMLRSDMEQLIKGV